MCFNSVSNSNFNSQLPLDIKNIIFAYTCFLEIDVPRWYKKQTIEAVVIGAVCREWYDIVRSTPHLWSTIAICFSRDRYHQQRMLFHLYLKNAKNCPLSISLDMCYWRYVDPIPKEITGTFEKMKDVGNMLKYLNICIIMDQEGFYQLAESHLPMLEEVKLEVKYLYSGQFPYDKMFCNSPRLRTMSVSGQIKVFKLAASTQLTDLRLESMSVKRCLKAIYFLPNLTHLTCDDINNGQDSEAPIRTSFTFPDGAAVVVHVSLVSLKIVNTEQKFVPAILRSILCPALREFHLCSESPDHPESNSLVTWNQPQINLLEPLGKFVKSSGCPLDTLKLELDSFNGDLWPALDCVNSTIEKLQLKEGKRAYHFDVFPPFIQRLSSTAFLPRLRECQIWIDEGPCDYHAVLQALRSRINSSTSENMIRLVLFEVLYETSPLNNEVDRNVVDGFEDLKRNGVDVLFKEKRGQYKIRTVKFKSWRFLEDSITNEAVTQSDVPSLFAAHPPTPHLNIHRKHAYPSAAPHPLPVYHTRANFKFPTKREQWMTLSSSLMSTLFIKYSLSQLRTALHLQSQQSPGINNK
ncbi:hypothetical protein BDQ17DRAFT_1415421 [Cyathus striatus]|nr:hypothetical protein BDQ17DRAFT_1415421 [Cyathus striatus]